MKHILSCVIVSTVSFPRSALPAKSAAEERRHQKLYEEMVTAARRKGEAGSIFVTVGARDTLDDALFECGSVCQW